MTEKESKKDKIIMGDNERLNSLEDQYTQGRKKNDRSLPKING